MKNYVGKIDFMFSQEFQNSYRLTKLGNSNESKCRNGDSILPYCIFIGE
jgi:hypothetical protein